MWCIVVIFYCKISQRHFVESKKSLSWGFFTFVGFRSTYSFFIFAHQNVCFSLKHDCILIALFSFNNGSTYILNFCRISVLSLNVSSVDFIGFHLVSFQFNISFFGCICQRVTVVVIVVFIIICILVLYRLMYECACTLWCLFSFFLLLLASLLF